MKRVDNICYPRSGHRLLAGIVGEYFGDEYISASVHNPRKVPSEATYIKNHDFEYKTKKYDSHKYLIQIRYPVDSIVSYYELQVKKFGQVDAPDAWTFFARTKMEYWIEFHNKWIHDVTPHSAVISYDDLITYPRSTCKNVIRFLSDGVVDKPKLHKILEGVDFKKTRDVTKFRYYDKKFFKELHNMVKNVKGVEGRRLRYYDGQMDDLLIATGNDNLL